MPDFTVIDGGNDSAHLKREAAQRNFEEFIIVLLRHIARGDEMFRVAPSFDF